MQRGGGPVLLPDARLPEANGLEAPRRVRETGREVLKMGAFDYITKPPDLQYLERSLWHKITAMLP